MITFDHALYVSALKWACFLYWLAKYDIRIKMSTFFFDLNPPNLLHPKIHWSSYGHVMASPHQLFHNLEIAN